MTRQCPAQAAAIASPAPLPLLPRHHGTPEAATWPWHLAPTWSPLPLPPAPPPAAQAPAVPSGERWPLDSGARRGTDQGHRQGQEEGERKGQAQGQGQGQGQGQREAEEKGARERGPQDASSRKHKPRPASGARGVPQALSLGSTNVLGRAYRNLREHYVLHEKELGAGQFGHHPALPGDGHGPHLRLQAPSKSAL